MSGTGKSTALTELAARGYRVVDTDDPGWKERRDGEWVWREDRMAELLAGDGDDTLYVSGCVSNQGMFYDRFDAVVLLSAPAEVILGRIETRTTNQFGKDPGERAQVLADLDATEPRLRATCTHEIDAARSVGDVVEALIDIEQRDAANSSPTVAGVTVPGNAEGGAWHHRAATKDRPPVYVSPGAGCLVDRMNCEHTKHGREPAIPSGRGRRRSSRRCPRRRRQRSTRLGGACRASWSQPRG